MNRNAKAWIEALRSSKYPQARQALRNSSGFCCLGVAADLYREKVGGEWHPPEPGSAVHQFVFPDEGTCSGYLSSKIREWLGLAEDSQFDLGALNDDKRYTFAQIADELEQHPKQYFATRKKVKA